MNIEQKELEIDLANSLDEELADADNHCYKCEREENFNTLLVCDHCVIKCCHTYCLDPPLEFIPENEWYCDYCVVYQNIQTTNPIAGIFRRRLRRNRGINYGGRNIFGSMRNNVEEQSN